MQAIQGVYDNGKLKLEEKAPIGRAKVIVIFTEETFIEKQKMSTEEALRIFHKHAGSIKEDVVAREERLAYLDERYGNIN